jgi:hypothetical protein
MILNGADIETKEDVSNATTETLWTLYNFMMKNECNLPDDIADELYYQLTLRGL